MTSILHTMALMSTLILAGTESPRFQLTGLRVEGAQQVSEALILAETELETGESYTENQLTLARRRLLRLPNVLRAEFSLEKGSNYGTFVLVIAIQEQSNLFYHYNYSATPGQSADISSDPYTTDALFEGGQLALGARGFLGTWWSWYLSTEFQQDQEKVNPVDGHPLDMGLTHRNLFGHHWFFNLHLQTRDTRDGKLYDPYLARSMDYANTRDLAPTLNLAAPLGKSGQWLSFSVAYLAESYLFNDEGPQLQDTVDERRWSGHLTWYRDTTDDLALPRSGSRFELGLAGIRVASDFSIMLTRALKPGEDYTDATLTEIFGELKPIVQHLAAVEQQGTGMPHVSGDYHARGLDLKGAAAYYRPVTSIWTAYTRASFSDRLSERGDLIRDPNRRIYTTLIGMDCDLAGMLPRRPLDDLRIQLAGGYRQHKDDFFVENITSFELALIWRQRWGLSRASLRYENQHAAFQPGPIENP